MTVGPDLSYNGANFDAFVAKVKADGTGLLYCGYIGGSGDDGADGIAVDSAGNAYVTGGTIPPRRPSRWRAGPTSTYNGGPGCLRGEGQGGRDGPRLLRLHRRQRR